MELFAHFYDKKTKVWDVRTVISVREQDLKSIVLIAGLTEIAEEKPSFLGLSHVKNPDDFLKIKGDVLFEKFKKVKKTCVSTYFDGEEIYSSTLTEQFLKRFDREMKQIDEDTKHIGNPKIDE